MGTWNPVEYDKAWTEMAARGTDPHGEVAFVERLLARHGLDPSLAILDAGCGTGRVAIELDQRGFRAEGTDVDLDMLQQASAKAPHLTWTHANLAHLDLGRTFDLVTMAGNVILFVDPVDQPLVAQSIRAHTNQHGIVVAGMQLARADGRFVSVSQYDHWMAEAGFDLIERYATWDDAPWTEGDYVVSVHRAAETCESR